MPPVSRFGSGNRAEKKLGIIDKIKAFFENTLELVKILRVNKYRF